jgi:hypothetical protein
MARSRTLQSRPHTFAQTIRSPSLFACNRAADHTLSLSRCMQELSGVSEASRDLAMSRFRLIQPYLEQKRSLQLVASDAKICFRTAQRWVSQYRKLGLVALVRKSREDRGARRVVSAKIKAAIEGLALEKPAYLSGPFIGKSASLPRQRTCRRHFSGRTTDPGSDSKPHTDDRRKLQALDPTSHSDRAGSQRQQPSSGLDRSRRSGTGQPRDWARMTPDTTNNSETLRQIAIKATA